ncbi:bifunctional riboflavin kinase/FAD synthetase [Oceanobacillus rekensis]|uniref:bifunctional riboflavin kinase/FAD synthetase n=1 Tax=Oceanobacillus rekensis TaxID=937927 RepID=UPI000B42D299|nr:bifunctional riboflavin kinase/FAD synthetase [Oceanobacillus rekensis]
MRTIELTYPHTLGVEDLPETVCAIGFFDGIHKGHQEVINTAVREAEVRSMDSAVITFHPHPSVVLKKEVGHVKYITPMKQKQERLENLQVDRLYIIKFNKELSQLSPQEFIDHFIIGLNIKHLVAGFDYSFGYKGKGNMENIKSFTRDRLSYTTIDKVTLENDKISSTRIRELLKSGRIDEANELLGRPLRFSGVVVKGDQRGREMGYPTANLELYEDVLLPRPGIYAVRVIYKNEVHEGMANIGTNPTFTADRKDLSIEINIFDYNNDLYGEELTVEWFKYMREEEKYDSVDALITQLALDEQNIRAYFSK